MSVFKSFTMFDYNREYFVILIRRGFEITKKWTDARNNLEKKLLEEKKKPEENFQMECELGTFLCNYDKHSKCYFILLANKKVVKEEHAKLLQTMKEKIMKIEHFIKLNRTELSDKISKELGDMLQEADDQYIQKNGDLEDLVTQQQLLEKKYRKELVNEILKKQKGQNSNEAIENILIAQVQESVPALVRIKAFTMFDYGRQFFFLTINQMIPVAKQWFSDRNLLQKSIMDNQKKPPQELELKGEGGIFWAKYDKEHKCYFALYYDESVSKDHVKEIVENVYSFVNTIPKYIKLKKEEIEGKYMNQVKSLICKKEIQNEKDFQNLDMIESNQIKLVCSPQCGQGCSKIDNTQIFSDIQQRQTYSKINNNQQNQFEESQPLARNV